MIRIPESWALEPEPSTFAPSSSWSNKDMDPVPPHRRVWTTWSFLAYWISDATNIAVWQLASSMIAVGLSWCACEKFFLSKLRV
jgi:NCS1 family nucleobase:cation symporter-1